MSFLDRISGWFRSPGKGDHGKSDLQKNMEKALEMKKAAGPQTNIPEHQTANEGMPANVQFGMTDRDAGSEGSHQPQLKRSQVPRSGDAS